MAGFQIVDSQRAQPKLQLARTTVTKNMDRINITTPLKVGRHLRQPILTAIQHHHFGPVWHARCQRLPVWQIIENKNHLGLARCADCRGLK